MGYFYYTDDNYVKVWTDGACFKNGQPGAMAGIGVFFGYNNDWNVSEPLVGRATNNHAEIVAVTRACEQAYDAGIDRLHIITDSKFVMDCWFKFMDKWKQRGWTTSTGSPVVNRAELEDMEDAVYRLGDVDWEHVNGHQGIFGNQQADELAREGAERYWEVNSEPGDYSESNSDSDSDDDYYY